MKLYKLFSLVALVLFVVNGFKTSAQEKRWLSYEPEVVEIEGRLMVQRKYGPPNFGENPRTDSKVRVPLLVLSEVVNIRGDPRDAVNSEVRAVRRIQLVFFDTSYKKFIGKRVLVKGTLFHANTGGHYTDVVMSVRSISSIRLKKHETQKTRKIAGNGPVFQALTLAEAH
jgi:hypothetical protein